jgi:metallo-beta-lactamase class B
MNRSVTFALLLASPLALAQEPRALRPDPPIACGACEEWNAEAAPFRVFGNTYSVGPAGLGAVLVTSPRGHVLLDGGLPQSAERIDASIRALGFRTEDVKLILSSHAHYDHAGGIAALQRASGAEVAASARGAEALQAGGPPPDDPQAGSSRFPAVPRVRVVKDGETVRVGRIAITAHYTPGHTPGATTWSWHACEKPAPEGSAERAGAEQADGAGETCLHVVYADSLNPVSEPGFRFTGGGGRPDAVAAFQRSIDVVAGLPCDVLLAVHPGFSRMTGALRARGASPGAPPVVDTGACRAYAEDARERLARRVAEEKAAPQASSKL